MGKYILVGCDLHDKTMLLKIAVGQGTPQKQSFNNCADARKAMIRDLQRRAAKNEGASVVFAYEASGLGFGLHDELTESGITCHVLAPSKIARSVKHRSCKTDEKDAERVLEILRGHYLAGNVLPDVWIPDKQTRDDREVVRARLDVQDKCSAVKSQVRTLLKRNGIAKPEDAGEGWTIRYRGWLKALAVCDVPLSYGARCNLASLMRQMESLEKEVQQLDKEIQFLALQPRYAEKVAKVTTTKGVGVLIAMVFLTEMGDPARFANRRQIGAFLGLVPSSNESGESADRKGHITHQGPARVRYVLTQAVWNRVRFDAQEKAVYERIAAKNPKHKKIAVVAAMRRLAIKLWHLSKAAG
jgi:transposase